MNSEGVSWMKIFLSRSLAGYHRDEPLNFSGTEIDAQFILTYKTSVLSANQGTDEEHREYFEVWDDEDSKQCYTTQLVALHKELTSISINKVKLNKKTETSRTV